MRQWIRCALVQIMASRLFDAKPKSTSMLCYCQLDPKDQTLLKFESKYNILHYRKCICKYLLWEGGHFIQRRGVKIFHGLDISFAVLYIQKEEWRIFRIIWCIYFRAGIDCWVIRCSRPNYTFHVRDWVILYILHCCDSRLVTENTSLTQMCTRLHTHDCVLNNNTGISLYNL